MPINEIKDYLSKLHHFQYLKIKINALAAEEITAEVMKHKLPNQKILIDGNEAFVSAESFMDYYSHWQNMSDIIVIEQPMPAAVNNEYLLLKKLCLTPLMADESILWQADQLPSLRFSFDYLNIKLMKTGGIIPALKLMNVARPLGFKFMLGCMIETSLSLSYALEVADLFHLFDVDGFLLLKNDPYNLLTEQDGLVYFQKH